MKIRLASIGLFISEILRIRTMDVISKTVKNDQILDFLALNNLKFDKEFSGLIFILKLGRDRLKNVVYYSKLTSIKSFFLIHSPPFSGS